MDDSSDDLKQQNDEEAQAPEEWKKIIERWYIHLGSLGIESFKKQWMEDPESRERFINWTNQKISNGATMLICSIWHGRLDIAKLLVDHGADITIPDNDGDTPLIIASDKGRVEIVKVLLEKGADPKIANKKRKTALMFASDKGHFYIMKLLDADEMDIVLAQWKKTMKSGLKEVDNEAFQKQWIGDRRIGNIINWNDDDFVYGFTMLHCAVRCGRLDIAKFLVKHGANVNIRDKYGKPVLTWASNEGYGDIVVFLLDNGADPKIVSKDGNSALMLASDEGHVDIMKLLGADAMEITRTLQEGWKKMMENMYSDLKEVAIDSFKKQWMESPIDFMNWTDPSIANGATMLNCSILCEREDIANLLVEHGADITIPDKNGDTPLINASRYGCNEIVEALLEKGADLKIANKKGWTALMDASNEGNTDTVKLLLNKGAHVYIADKNGSTALSLASNNGHVDIMKLLDADEMEIWKKIIETSQYELKNLHIDSFAEQWMQHQNIESFIDWKDDSILNGKTMLLCALNYGRLDIAKLLVEQGADVHITNKFGWTALMYATNFGGNTEMLQLLLDKGVDVNIANEGGQTALMLAIQEGHFDAVKLLLDKGGNEDRNAALMMAAEKGHFDIMKLFGADEMEIALAHWKDIIEPRNYKRGMYADMEAFTKQWVEDTKIGSFINRKDDDIADGATMLLSAVDRDRLDIAEFLLERGADLNLVNKRGWTALMYASNDGKTDTVKFLLEKGADITIVNKLGETALMVACGQGDTHIVKLLLDEGADITIVSNTGRTALTIAINNGHTKVVKLLSEKIAADPNMRNSDGQTLLHLACLHNRKRDAQKVLELGGDKDKADKNGHIALYYAAEKGFVDIVEWLIVEHGAAVNKTDERKLIEKTGTNKRGEEVTYSFYSVKDGRTPLFIAAQNGHQNVVAVLLQHGADPYLCNHESKIPYHVSKQYVPIQQLLKIHDYFEKREKVQANKRKYKTCRDNSNHYDEYKPSSVPPLKNIIHDIVKYPHFADKFLELYQENREIVNWHDKDDRTVQQVACKECRRVILFLGRYDVNYKAKYESPTCKIYSALDYGGPGEKLKQPRKVVMKFIRKFEHFENEMHSRRNADGTPRFDAAFVTPDLASYCAGGDHKYAEACKKWHRALTKEKDTEESDFLQDHSQLLVMPEAERSGFESMNAENLSAEHKDLPRREMLLRLTKIFSYIHGEGYVHGDIKPHNVVRHIENGNMTWKAIDFDACTKIGEVVGLKLTSGSAPPEMLKVVQREEELGPKVILRQPGADGLVESELVKADPSFDVWSFGILMYQLLTGRSFFHCDIQGNLDDAGLQDLANLTQRRIHQKLKSVKGVNARGLLSKILRLDPKERPTMSEIEENYYFHPSESPQGRQANFFHKKGFDDASKEENPPPKNALDEANDATNNEKDEDSGNNVDDLKKFLSARSEFSYFKLRDEDMDWNDKLLHSEVETFRFDNLEGMGEKPKCIDGDFIYNNLFLRNLLSSKGPDYFMGFLVEYFELYKIMHDAHEACQEMKTNLVSDVKSLKGIFIKLFVRGKGLNDVVRGTLFCNSIDQFRHVGRKLTELYGHNVYIKPPKQAAGSWPIPKLLVYGNRRIGGRCMSVEIQFSTVYMHLALHASSSHVVYEAMRRSTGYLGGKDKDFQAFLQSLNRQHIDTEGFLRDQTAEEGRFEVLVEKKVEETDSGATPSCEDGESQYTTKATGFILSGRVRCGDRVFQFLRSKDEYQRYSESSFVVNRNLTLLSSHSYWSEESYDLEGKSVEFVVSFKGRGMAIAGIGTTKCMQGASKSDRDNGTRWSVHVGRSKFVVRKNGIEEVFREKKLPNQERAKINFKMKGGALFASFVGSEREHDEETEFQVSMPLDQRYYLYMRAPPGVHDVKFHDIKIRESFDMPEELMVTENVNLMDSSSKGLFSDTLTKEIETKTERESIIMPNVSATDLNRDSNSPADKFSSPNVEKKVPIFEGWLSKQSLKDSNLWQDRYFEVYTDGDVMCYPEGIRPDYIKLFKNVNRWKIYIKLFNNVHWCKIVGEDKVELRSLDNAIFGIVKLSKKSKHSTVDEWCAKGNSWMGSKSIRFAREKRGTSKPRPVGALVTASGDINTWYAG